VTSRPAVGFALQPDAAFLAHTEELVADHVDLVEVAPETLWRVREDAAPDDPELFAPNGFFDAILAIGRRHGCTFAAHGVGWSPGSLPGSPEGERTLAARRAAWREAIAATHQAYGFRWYTDHLGASFLNGQELILPLAVPMTERHGRAVAAAMAELQSLVPVVGLENTVAYFLLGDPLDEPGFLSRALSGPDQHVLLDLHNLHTMSVNHGFDPDDWLARLPLESVLEIHVSGGRDSEPGWLADGAVVRLDSHDDAVPEAVFELLERVAPRCPKLAAVTLERMEGTVGPDDVAVLRDELRRVREVVA
jgi:hypothetical protein